VALVRTDVSAERSVSIMKGTRATGLGTTLAITSSRCTLEEILLCIYSQRASAASYC
jgi:hypothetical protein